MTLTYKLADGGFIDVDVEDLSSYEQLSKRRLGMITQQKFVISFRNLRSSIPIFGENA